MTITEEQVSQFGMTVGLSVLILFMMFIIWDLSRKSKAGKFGTFILFFGLAFGIFGFVVKYIIKMVLGLNI